MPFRNRLAATCIVALTSYSCVMWAQDTTSTDPQLASILKKVDSLNNKKSSNKKWNSLHKLLGEACELGHAQSCLKRAEIGHLIPADKYSEAATVADLKRSCTIGDNAVCIGAAKALIHRKEQAIAAQQMLEDACAKNSHYACNELALALRQGKHLKMDLGAAKSYFQRACDLGSSWACKDASAILDQGQPGFKEQLEQAKVRSGRLQSQSITNPKDKVKLEKILLKISKVKNSEELVRLRNEACDLGDAYSCEQAYYNGTRNSKLLQRACELSTYYCTSSALNLIKTNSLERALDLLEYGCDVGYDHKACLGLADFYKGEPAVSWKPDMNSFIDLTKARHYYELACTIEKVDSTTPKCNALQTFEKAYSPTGLAEKQAAALRVQHYNRGIPLGAYSECIDTESQRFGKWLDKHTNITSQQAEGQYFKFIQQCGGSYVRPHVDAICANLAARPAHHRLLCLAASGEKSFTYQHPTSKWQLTAKDIVLDVKIYNAITDVSSLANDDHLLPPSSHRLDAVPDQVLSSVARANDELLFADYTNDTLVITVNRPGHDFTVDGFAEFYPNAGLLYLLSNAPNPNEAGVADGHEIAGSIPKLDQTRHFSRWDAERQGWQAQTQIAFTLRSELTPRLLTDLNLWVRVSDGKGGRYFKLDPNTLQRWVLSRYIFWDQGRIPDAVVSDAMITGYQRAQADTNHNCGDYKQSWRGSTSDTFSKADERINSQSRMLKCRQTHLEKVQGRQVANSGALPQSDPEYWRQAQLLRFISATEATLPGWQSELENFKQTIAAEWREAERADRRAERLARQEEKVNTPNKRDEFFAQEAQRSAERDHLNALRVAQGYPPLPTPENSYRKKQKSSSSKSSTKNSTGRSASGNNGSAGSANNDEDAQRAAASHQRVQEWLDRYHERCQRTIFDHTGGSNCLAASTGVQSLRNLDYEAQSPRNMVIDWEASARQSIDKTGQCPTDSQQLADGRRLYYQPIGERISETTNCDRFTDGDYGAAACRMTVSWTCETAFSGQASK